MPSAAVPWQQPPSAARKGCAVGELPAIKLRYMELPQGDGGSDTGASVSAFDDLLRAWSQRRAPEVVIVEEGELVEILTLLRASTQLLPPSMRALGGGGEVEAALQVAFLPLRGSIS